MFCKEVYPLINTEKDDTVLIEKEGLINSLIVNIRKKINSLIVNIRKNSFGILILTPALLYLLAFLIIILYQIIILSLTYVAPNLAETFPTVKNFLDLANNKEFIGAFKRTIVFTLIGTPLELIAGMIAAGLIYREFRGRGIIRSLFIIPLAIPGIVTAIILFILFDFPFGHINDLLLGRHSFFPKIISYPIPWRSSATFSLGVAMFGKVWRDMPISMLIILSGLQSITRDQYEAAKTMGAGALQQFKYITLPLLIPAISTVLVLRSIEMWKEFIFPFILAGSYPLGSYPLLGTLIERAYHEWNSATEAATIGLILLFCIVVFTTFLFYSLSWLRKKLVKI
jgi:ABC-type sugar transport system permease subunit